MKNSLISGLPMILLGGLVTTISASYPVGTASHMGPGFMPLVCGILLALLGAMICLFDKETLAIGGGQNLIRPIAAVFGGLILWAVTVESLGLVAATFLMVGAVAFAQRKPRLVPTLITAAVLTAFGVFVFIMGLKIRLHAFGA